jgi:hypothetical protein
MHLGKLRRLHSRIARYLVIPNDAPSFNNYSPMGRQVALRNVCLWTRRGHASPCFSAPTLPPRRKSSVRIDDRRGLWHSGCCCDAEATNRPARLGTLIRCGTCGDLTAPNWPFLITDFVIDVPRSGLGEWTVNIPASSSERVPVVGITQKGHHLFERRNVELCN